MTTMSDDDWFHIQKSYGHFMRQLHFLVAEKVLPSESTLLTQQMEYWWNTIHRTRNLQRGYDMKKKDDDTYEYYSPARDHTVRDKPPWDRRDTLNTQTPAPVNRVVHRRRSWFSMTEANPYIIE